MVLNKLQKKVYNEVLSGTEEFITLLGEAGTGKSTTVAEIIKDYPNKADMAITATSNKAKDILALLSEEVTQTIHKQSGFKLVSKDFSQFLAKTKDAEPTNLLIVDEISMLPKILLTSILDRVKRGILKKSYF